MERIIIKAIFLFALNSFLNLNNSFAQKESYKAIHYHREVFDTTFVSEIWYDFLGIRKEYAYIHEKNRRIIKRVKSKPQNWEKDSTVNFPICKVTLVFTKKNRIAKNTTIEHFFYEREKKGLVICKSSHQYKHKKGYTWSLKKWHSNKKLAYKEHSNPKKEYCYKRYDKKGRLLAKWQRNEKERVRRLDGWATLYEEGKKAYKLLIDQSRVIKCVKYNQQGKEESVKEWDFEEWTEIQDALPRRFYTLLYLEKSCKSICFPPENEVSED